MRIDKIEVKPVIDSINPELMFEIYCFIERKYEIPLEITGYILSEDNKKIANIHQVEYLRDLQLELSARGGRDTGESNFILKLIAPLTHKALDYIETLRTVNSKSDIVLNVEIFVKILKSRTLLSYLHLGKSNPQDFQPVYYKYQSEEYHIQQNNMWILSGDSSSTFIETINKNFSNKIVIPSSDWIHDYCPVFQIGKFAVFEYLLPEYTEGTGSIEERLNESINAIKKMEEDLVKGEWNGVIENSRPVCELLKHQDEIKDLLITDGYTEQAFIELNKSLQNLFNYSSKFIHKLDKGKRLMPDIKASKEDAYLIYSLSMSLVNLISKKYQRLNNV